MATDRDLKDLLKDLGECIRRLRKDRDLTQQQLADLSGSSWITIQRIESANVSTQIDKLWRVAKALEVRLAEILEEVEGKGTKQRRQAKGVWEEMKRVVDEMPLKDREWIGKIIRTTIER